MLRYQHGLVEVSITRDEGTFSIMGIYSDDEVTEIAFFATGSPDHLREAAKKAGHPIPDDLKFGEH